MKLKPHFTAALLTALISQASWALEPVVKPIIIKPESLELKIKPDQEARIKSITEDMNVQIKSAFKGEEPLQNEMQTELEKIVAMTDETAKRAAVTIYQNKYKSRYQAILTKNKINLADFAGRLNGAAPEMEFTVTPNMLIKAKPRAIKNVNPNQIFEISEDALQSVAVLKQNIKKANEAQTQTAQAQSQPANTTRTITLNMDNYADDPSRGCGLVGGVANTLSNKTIKLTGKVAVLGGCDTTNNRTIRFTLPKRTKATVTVTGDLYCYGFSAAVGLSISQAIAKAGIVGDNQYCSVRSNALAFMAGYDEDPTNNISHTIYINNTTNQDKTIEQLISENYIHLFSMGAGGATAESKISNFTVSVKLEPM
jgi:hypothetical protein